MTQNVFVVLGVARSGTSAIARGLKALGVDLGSNFVDVDTKWNAKGFWEDSDIVYQINGRVFRTLNFAPYGIETLDASKQTGVAVQDIKVQALDLLKKRFANTNLWGFKDPSTVKLLPFWQSVFATADVKENYVICLRNPLSSAHSYQKLTGCDLEIGLLLWLMHMVPAIAQTHLKRRIVVSYERLLKNPRTELSRIQQHLEMQIDSHEAEISQYMDEFLDENLLHHDNSEQDLLVNSAVQIVPLCIDFYCLLLQLAKDEIAFESDKFQQQWQRIEAELQRVYPIYAYLDLQLKKNYQLTRTLKEIRKSWVWKIYSPFKNFYDGLRDKERNQRREKRIAKAYG